MDEENAYANIAGSLSIACWIVVFTPQILENYRNKSGESLSLSFLWIWLIGDFFNIIGAAMEGLLPTMLVLGAYYTIADIILIVQIYYYRRQKRNELTLDEESPLLQDDTLEEGEDDVERYTMKKYMWKYAIPVCIGIIYILVSYIIIMYIGWSQYLGWIAAILYVSSRIPQIMKNIRNGSVEGLSLAMFMLGIIGNGLFVASILLQSLKHDYIMRNLPWLVGSGGTLIFDILIGIQFAIYKRKHEIE